MERVLNKENLDRSRLRIDTRKWLLARLFPKNYGDNAAIEHSGDLSLRDLVRGSYGPIVPALPYDDDDTPRRH